jgi:hypothetical protein
MDVGGPSLFLVMARGDLLGVVEMLDVSLGVAPRDGVLEVYDDLNAVARLYSTTTDRPWL